MTESEEFRACTTKNIAKNGRTTIACKMGLWSVDAWHEINAVSEALYYFRQYRDDGEYADLIGSEND